MPSIRAIKDRIQSVESTRQITGAMNLVAASKLQKMKTRLHNARPFYTETSLTISEIIRNSKNLNHEYFKERSTENILIVLVTADRGLCGGYNINASKEARNLIRGETKGALIIVGTKGRDFFLRRRKKILKTITGISEIPFYADAAEIGSIVLDLYKNKEYDKVFLVYTEFKSMLNHEPKTIQLLPIDTKSYREEESNKNKSLMSYDPNEYEVLDYIIPKYVNTTIYGALVESATCQQAARMTGMEAATENANEMIADLSIKYNRARQGIITQELTEIVGGAGALK